MNRRDLFAAFVICALALDVVVSIATSRADAVQVEQ